MKILYCVICITMMACTNVSNKVNEVFSPGANYPNTFLITEDTFTGMEYYTCVDTMFKWFPEFKIPELYHGNYIDYFVTNEDILFFNPSDSLVAMFTGHPGVALRFIDNINVHKHFDNEITIEKKAKAKEMYEIFISKMNIVRDSLIKNGVDFYEIENINSSKKRGLW